MQDLSNQRDRIHAWGARNRVQFEPSKEEMLILHPIRGMGDDFRLLGCILDNKLGMESAITAILKKIRPKIKSLLRTRPYYSVAEMIR